VDSSVSIVTRLWAGRQFFNFWERQGIFSSPPRPAWFWGLPSGYCELYPGSKAVRSWSWPLTSIKCRI